MCFLRCDRLTKLHVIEFGIYLKYSPVLVYVIQVEDSTLQKRDQSDVTSAAKAIP